MKFLLDPCVVEALLKAESGHENIRERIAAAPQGSLAISALTADRAHALRRAREIARKYKKPGQSVVKALLRERQAEAGRE